jgi:hypothetical protein
MVDDTRCEFGSAIVKRASQRLCRDLGITHAKRGMVIIEPRHVVILAD